MSELVHSGGDRVLGDCGKRREPFGCCSATRLLRRAFTIKTFAPDKHARNRRSRRPRNADVLDEIDVDRQFSVSFCELADAGDSRETHRLVAAHRVLELEPFRNIVREDSARSYAVRRYVAGHHNPEGDDVRHYSGPTRRRTRRNVEDERHRRSTGGRER